MRRLQVWHWYDINTPYLRMFIDFGVATNSGNKHHHRHVMNRFPDLVADHSECGADINYDIVKLKRAVT